MKNFTPIIFSDTVNQLKKDLSKTIKSLAPNKIAIICDSNTLEHCYRLIADVTELLEVELIEVDPGEESKNIEITTQLWISLMELNFNKNDVIINLGGGMVCDLGGFVASTYKRGMPFIHIPTTYLAMVDAAIGGKQGINLLKAKNQVGIIVPQVATLICLPFLDTLPKRQWLSGAAETLKHGLIAHPNIWIKAKANFNDLFTIDTIKASVEVKLNLVNQDPHEKNVRKKLNFGHTVGHAIENRQNLNLLHGEAVAWGILVETFISVNLLSFPMEDYTDLKNLIIEHYGKPVFDIGESIKMMRNDKKNNSEKINFTLLNSVGNAQINQMLTEDQLEVLLTKFSHSI